MPVESGKLKLNLKGGTPWIEKKKKKKKIKAPEADVEPATEEVPAEAARAGPTTTSRLLSERAVTITMTQSLSANLCNLQHCCPTPCIVLTSLWALAVYIFSFSYFKWLPVQLVESWTPLLCQYRAAKPMSRSLRPKLNEHRCGICGFPLKRLQAHVYCCPQ